MEPTAAQLRQGHRLLQAGVAIFLAALFIGLALPYMAVPRLALSAHLVGMLQGIFLLVLGLAWGRLTLGRGPLALAFCLLIYQAIAAPVANLLAALWGAGNSIIPMAAGAAHGTPLQETVINFGLRSAGAALIVALVLVLWGLHRTPSGPA